MMNTRTGFNTVGNTYAAIQKYNHTSGQKIQRAIKENSGVIEPNY